MNFNFLPPLQHMAAVKIALCVYYDKDIEQMLKILSNIPRGKKYFHREILEYWKLIETKVADKLPSLPCALRTRVSKFIRPLQRETSFWCQDHEFLELGCCRNDCSFFLDVKSILCWKTDGTIERTQTAKNFIRSKSFTTEMRFAIACIYFLEDEVLALWHGDEVLNMERFIYVYGTNAALRFWMRRLKKRSSRKIPWKAAVNGYFKNLPIRKSDIQLRISSFFPYLSREGKENCLIYLSSFTKHNDDFWSCLRELNTEERLEIISVFPENVLLCFLSWPFQSLFIDIAEHVWTRMNSTMFKGILHYIIFDKILEGSEDIDHARLLKEFWHLSPASYKRKILKQKSFFKLIEAAWNYNEKNTELSLPETIEALLS